MFDNTKPNIIILADSTDVLTMQKTLGPYKVAFALRQQGFEVAVIHHLSIFSLSEIKTLLRGLISNKTLFVGVNNFFYADIGKIIVRKEGGIEPKIIDPGCILPHGAVYNLEIKNLIKECNPDCKLVLGGQTARDANFNNIFDYIVVGYAEKSLVNLAMHLVDQNVILNHKHRSIYGPIIVNDTGKESYDFSQSDMRYENHDGILPKETLLLEIARGCIFKCAFCSSPLTGKKKLDFIRNMELIKNELIDNYNRFGVTRYIFCDDTVNDSVEKCKMLYDMSKTLPFKLEWWGYVRLDLLLAHPQTVEHLFGSGLRAAFFGIETLNRQTAAAIGKSGNREKLISTIRKIKETYGNDISLHGSFIFGLPKESIESMQKTAEFLLSYECPLDSWRITPLSIRPSGQSYDNGFVSDIDKNYEKYGYVNKGSKLIDNGLYSSVRHAAGQMLWENEHTNFNEVLEIVNDIEPKMNFVTGNGVFYLAGLGFDLSEFINKKKTDIDWRSVDKVKLHRAKEYKKVLCSGLNLKQLEDSMAQFETFSDWLKSGDQLK